MNKYWLVVVGILMLLIAVNNITDRYAQNFRQETTVAAVTNMYISEQPFGVPVKVIKRADLKDSYWLMFDTHLRKECLVTTNIGLTKVVVLGDVKYVYVLPLERFQVVTRAYPSTHDMKYARLVYLKGVPREVFLPGDYQFTRTAIYDCYHDSTKLVTRTQAFNFSVDF